MKKALSVVTAMMIAIGILTLAPVSADASASRQAGIVATSQGRLNVRASASTSASVVSSLNKGGYVTLISNSGSWWRVEYAAGRYGYVSADYINQAGGSPATVQTSSGNLNVRAGAGTSYRIDGSLSKGTQVVVLSQSGGWSRILYHGIKTGYVSSQYLKQSAQAYGSIALSLPNFKQTDSRWANVQIGSSGKTISQIGCTTTAIAMMESYRTGKTITPDAMSKKLSYSSSGDLYWPSDYVNVTSSAGYLNKIYELLQQGKPVLMGAKTSAGRQHWAVITGFIGGSSLTADRFTIHDPGSNSRTTLQHLLNAYPAFYKLVYYK